jgi:hypothetical protein
MALSQFSNINGAVDTIDTGRFLLSAVPEYPIIIEPLAGVSATVNMPVAGLTVPILPVTLNVRSDAENKTSLPLCSTETISIRLCVLFGIGPSDGTVKLSALGKVISSFVLPTIFPL